MIPYGRQDINQLDIDAVVEVLQSDFLTQGPKVPAFERAVADYCGAKHAVAVNSATSALHMACLTLGVGVGDRVWTTPITFVATANCALYCGALIDFVDIDPLTYNISVARLSEKLVDAEKNGSLPKVVIPVHFSGQSCDMVAIHALGQRYGFKIIEDASHAIGGRYKNEPVGNCRYSDITVFSFHPVKIITTGEGGALLTNDPVIANQLVRLRSHGITRDAAEMTHAPDGPWYYQQIELGYNYRMTEIQAALGLSQMRRLDEFVAKRQALANNYNELLANESVVRPMQHADCYSSTHLYVIRLRLSEIEASHCEVFERLRVNGIGVNLHYIPVYRQPYFARMGFNVQDFPEAENYYAGAISLPMYSTLLPEQQQEVVKRLVTPIGHQTLF
jgi:UDP-4-amino-4,6-dideoxy-N-acetyl-beta-L-altrosamine transaminase